MANKKWRPAKALDSLLAEVNSAYPKRDKTSDGSIGNEEHSSRASDHNPNSKRVVCARDFDGSDGVGDALAAHLEKTKDSRVQYVIYKGRMLRSYAKGNSKAWTWAKYTGPNAHMGHVHVSVKQDESRYDDASGWGFAGASASSGPAKPAGKPAPVKPAASKPAPAPAAPRWGGRLITLASGRRPRADVRAWQLQMRRRGWKVVPDGFYGPASEAVCRAFQREKGLGVDGKVGPATWAAAWTARVS